MDNGVPDQSRLVAGEAELRMLLDSVPARVALLDRNRRHWYVNQDYARFGGHGGERLVHSFPFAGLGQFFFRPEASGAEIENLGVAGIETERPRGCGFASPHKAQIALQLDVVINKSLQRTMAIVFVAI